MLTARRRVARSVWVGARRYLSSEVIAEYNERAAKVDETVSYDDLYALAKEIVPFDMQHNAEADACDLLMELERIHHIVEHVDKANYQRVCLYLSTYVATFMPTAGDGRRYCCRMLTGIRRQVRLEVYRRCRCVNYVPDPEDRQILEAVLAIYRRLELLPDALTVALRMNDIPVAKEIFENCTDPYVSLPRRHGSHL